MSWTDGCKCNVQSDAAGGLSEFFVCTDPAKFQDSDYTDYEKRGEIPRNEGYVKIMMIGEYGENMPIEVGASSTTYFCDYYARGIPSSGSVTRGVLSAVLRMAARLPAFRTRIRLTRLRIRLRISAPGFAIKPVNSPRTRAVSSKVFITIFF